MINIQTRAWTSKRKNHKNLAAWHHRLISMKQKLRLYRNIKRYFIIFSSLGPLFGYVNFDLFFVDLNNSYISGKGI